jgi:hypothetical protein
MANPYKNYNKKECIYQGFAYLLQAQLVTLFHRTVTNVYLRSRTRCCGAKVRRLLVFGFYPNQEEPWTVLMRFFTWPDRMPLRPKGHLQFVRDSS